MRVHGVSLHYFNEGANSDKFYRVMNWQTNGTWYVGFSWGRDGTAGQSKTVRAASQQAAERMSALKVREQTGKKRYQHLGEGFADIPDSFCGNLPMMGQILHAKVGRPPVKMPSGIDFVIFEETDIEDLLCLST